MAACLAPWAALQACAAPLVYDLDPRFSFVDFEVLHFGTSTLRGRFGPVQGTVVLDAEAQRGEVGLAIDTVAVSTGWPALDARLRAPDLLSSVAFPQAFFVATRFAFDGDAVAEVRGEFTWRGVGRPLALKALRFGCHAEPVGPTAEPGRRVCGGDFEAHVARSDFGATFGLPLVADDVRLLVRVQGLQRER